MSVRPAILDQFSALADGTRCRLLSTLETQELTVSELCEVLQLPQSTVSRHLKILSDLGWVLTRPEGTRRLYRLLTGDLEPSAGKLWSLAREQLDGSAAAAQDARRLQEVLARRVLRSREFFASTAGAWDRTREELFGPRFHLVSLLGLLAPEWRIADLGCGTGPVAEALAPWVSSVVAVDGSQAMLDAARERLRASRNVELRRGELEALPIEDGQVDAATLILVLHHIPDPARVVAEAARILRPGGRLLLVDMLPHERHEYHQQMGHLWMGFGEEQTRRILSEAGLQPGAVRQLPVENGTKGPALFAATAVRGSAAPHGAAADSKYTDLSRTEIT